MRVLKLLTGLCALAGALALAGSYLGALHPVGDSLAVFRIWLAGGMALAGLLLWIVTFRRTGWLAIGFAAFAAAPIAAMVYAPMGEAPAEAVTIYTKNTLGGWGDEAAIVADIEASGADIVMLQEVSQSRSDFGAAFSGSHPHQHICPFSDWSGIAVLSRWPVLDTYCSPHRSFAAARVDAPGGPIWAVSTHLVWPYPHGQAVYLEAALPFLDAIEGRVIVAGDFNMVPWSHSIRRIAQATGSDRIGPLFTTIEVRDVGLQIDHVLSDGTGIVERRPRLGSDHYGLVARIGWD